MSGVDQTMCRVGTAAGTESWRGTRPLAGVPARSRQRFGPSNRFKTKNRALPGFRK